MHKNILLLIAFLGSQSLLSQTIVNPGNVQGTWNKASSPYLVNGDLVVPADQKLTIQEGVTVEMQGLYRIRVYGSIQALGKANDTILFTPKNKTTGWKGITVYGSSTKDSIIFDHVKMEYGRNFTYNFKTDTGVLHIQERRNIAISNCLFWRNKGSRYPTLRLLNDSFLLSKTSFIENEAVDDRANGNIATNSALVVIDCVGEMNQTVFKKNKCWAPNNANDSTSGNSAVTVLFSSSKMQINDCHLDSNYCTRRNAGIAISRRNGYYQLNNVKFTNNSSREGQTLGFSFETDPNNQVTLKNCLFDNNISRNSASNDIFMYSLNAFGNSVKVYNTLFTNSVLGSVYTLANGTISFYNCVWENNDVETCISSRANASFNLYNCRITNNSNGVSVYDGGKANIYNSLIAYNGSPDDTFKFRHPIYNLDAPGNIGIYNSIISGNRSQGRVRTIATQENNSNGYINKIYNTILEGGTSGTRHFERSLNPKLDTAHILDAQNVYDVVPQFVNPPSTYGVAGFKPGLDFHLVNNCTNSPGYMHEQGTLINLGIPSGDTFPSTDLDGSPRIRCEQIDIGPYEIEGLANAVDVKLVQDTFMVCPGLAGELISKHCGSAITYQWQQETTPNSWKNLQTQPKQSASEIGKYRVIATQVDCGTADTAYGWLENHPQPQPNLGADRNLDGNDSITFNPGSFQSYSWSTGANTPTLKLKPIQNGDTSIWVSIIDDNGCVGGDTVTITVTGIDNVALLQKLNIQAYPNPTSETLYLTNASQIQEIIIYDLQGRERLKADQAENGIQLSNLPSGVYILTLKTEAGIAKLRVIKK